MKALSIQQPWAWLIVNGFKPVENRTWRTDYRGPLLIHAGKKVDEDGIWWVRDGFPEIQLPQRYDLGGIVGQVELTACVSDRARELLGMKDRPWFFGPYGFLFSRPRALPFRPLRGQLGMFEVPDA